MIRTVDENGDGKINYQEFRVMIGAKPNLKAQREAQKLAEAKKKAAAKAEAENPTTTLTSTTVTSNAALPVAVTVAPMANNNASNANIKKWECR